MSAKQVDPVEVATNLIAAALNAELEPDLGGRAALAAYESARRAALEMRRAGLLSVANVELGQTISDAYMAGVHPDILAGQILAAVFAAEPPAEAIEAFERVFYAEHPQDCVRPLSKALRAFLDVWESHFANRTMQSAECRQP